MSLRLTLWSIRTLSSRTSVGKLLPPIKLLPWFGAGKIPPYLPPAASSAWAFGFNRLAGILLLVKGTTKFGSGPPFEQPLNAWLAAANCACIAEETWQIAGACSCATLYPEEEK